MSNRLFLFVRRGLRGCAAAGGTLILGMAGLNALAATPAWALVPSAAFVLMFGLVPLAFCLAAWAPRAAGRMV